MHHKLTQNRPKKRLGQSFLKDSNIIDKIINSCQLQKGDTVLEIGAGHGELTSKILEKAGRVVVVEIDDGLCKVLNEKFGQYKNVEIMHKDILAFDIRNYFKKSSTKIKIIGNIPYYITTPIIEHLFGCLDIIEVIFLTVQKEFARRIVSSPGSKDYGSFSCFAQYYAAPQILFYIKKGSFRPMPKVDSAFIKLSIRDSPLVKVTNEAFFFKIIRAAFSQKRKMISNSLKGVLPAQILEEYFQQYGTYFTARPQDLALQDFAHLVNIASTQKNPK